MTKGGDWRTEGAVDSGNASQGECQGPGTDGGEEGSCVQVCGRRSRRVCVVTPVHQPETKEAE